MSQGRAKADVPALIIQCFPWWISLIEKKMRQYVWDF